MTRNGSSGFTTIASRTLRSNASSTSDCRALSSSEQQLWELSSRINERGFCVDRKFAEAARRIAQAAAPEIDQELAEITGGVVTGINQVARLTAWLQQQGCAVEKLDKKAIEKLLLDPGLPPQVQRVLELRLGGAQAAVKKIDALLARAGDDDRVRGAFRYHGAATGRWAGEGFQPQNLKRPAVDDLEAAVAAVATGDYAHVRSLYPRPLSVVGDCSRSMICAAPGHVLIGADFGASKAGCWPGLPAKSGSSMPTAASTPHAIPVTNRIAQLPARYSREPPGTYTKDSPERSIGKTCDLAFGYMGGLEGLAEIRAGEIHRRRKSRRSRASGALRIRTIKRFWYDIDRAAWTAVRERGRVVSCGRVAFKMHRRVPAPEAAERPQAHLSAAAHHRDRDARNQVVVFADNAAGQFKDCRRGHGAYGGLWTENIVSGIARDLLADAMLRIEAAGYPIVLHVHDELVCRGAGRLRQHSKNSPA